MPVTCHNTNPLDNGLDLILEELVKFVLVMEYSCPSMLQNFDKDGDHYSTQHHNHRKHHFPIPCAYNRWPCDADGNKLPGTMDEIYKFPHMITNIITKATAKTTTRTATTKVTKVTARKRAVKHTPTKGK